MADLPTGLQIAERRNKERGPRSVVYFISARGPADFPVKIGITTPTGLVSRLECIQTALPYTLELLATTHGGVEREAEIHAQFAHLRLRGEWFRRSYALNGFIRETGTVVPYPKKFRPL